MGDASLLECIDDRQIEQSGIVSRSVWILNGHEVFGVGRQVGEMNVPFGKVNQPRADHPLFHHE